MDLAPDDMKLGLIVSHFVTINSISYVTIIEDNNKISVCILHVFNQHSHLNKTKKSTYSDNIE